MIGIVLVSKDWYYLGENGELPVRPALDKGFLLKLCEDKNCLASENTLKTLPPSLFKKAKYVGIWNDTEPDTYDINLGINTFDIVKPDTFYIVQSDKYLNGGKKFDQVCLKKNYKLLVKDTYLRIYEKRQYINIYR